MPGGFGTSKLTLSHEWASGGPGDGISRITPEIGWVGTRGTSAVGERRSSGPAYLPRALRGDARARPGGVDRSDCLHVVSRPPPPRAPDAAGGWLAARLRDRDARDGGAGQHDGDPE